MPPIRCLVLMRLRVDALLLPAIYYYLFFFRYNLPSSSNDSCRPSSSSRSVFVLLFILLSILLSLFLYYDLMLLTYKIQEGFSIRVGCSTKCTQYLFCNHFFRAKMLLLDTPLLLLLLSISSSLLLS